MKNTLLEKEKKLRSLFLKWQNVLVAYSGGVDSTLVAKIAFDVLGENSLAVLADSPSLPRHELKEARALSKRHGFSLKIVKPHEMDNPRYLENPANRCFFCKEALYLALDEIRDSKQVVLDGTHAGDHLDFRPGLQATKQAGVQSPLAMANLDKQEVRALSKTLGLENWDKPATPCLSSRIPHGIPISLERLGRIERAENVLRALGFRESRVRDHEPVARIELPVQAMALALEKKEKINQEILSLGFRYCTLDFGGLRSGSLHPLIEK